MGIDRHELEHRNWRSTAAPAGTEPARGIAEQLDTSIVPSDTPAEDAGATAVPAKRVKRAKTDQLR